MCGSQRHSPTSSSRVQLLLLISMTGQRCQIPFASVCLASDTILSHPYIRSKPFNPRPVLRSPTRIQPIRSKPAHEPIHRYLNTSAQPPCNCSPKFPGTVYKSIKIPAIIFFSSPSSSFGFLFLGSSSKLEPMHLKEERREDEDEKEIQENGGNKQKMKDAFRR